MKMENPYRIREVNGKDAQVFFDVRPDSGSPEEHIAFMELLTHLYILNKQAAGILHGFRCQGINLIKTEKGNYAIRPIIGENGWESQECYDKAKEKYLEPIRRDLLLALKRLN